MKLQKRKPWSVEKKIKVCRLATVPFFLVSQLESQLEFLKNSGCLVVVITSAGPEIGKLNLGASLIYEPVEIKRNISPLKDIHTLLRLFLLFRRYKFDIVHSTTPKAGLLAALAAYLNSVPIRLHTWTGQQWVTQSGVTRFLSRMADRTIGLLNTKCYADSQSQARFLVAQEIIAGEKIDIINKGSLSGVDLTRFDKSRWSKQDKELLKNQLGLKPDSLVILFMGRVTIDKGIRELVSAFEILLKEGYDVDLLIVGPSDEECGGGKGATELKDISKIDRIHRKGYTNCPEKYFALSDIFCLPSYREGFGTTVIEAAAMGIPTVGTRINGLIDAVEDGETGILVPVRNHIALADALKNLLDSSSRLKNMGRSALKRCQSLFDHNLVNRAVLKEYLELIDKKKRSQE